MKKSLLVICLTLGFLSTFSQSHENQVEISNEVLKRKLEEYVSYIKDWSVRTQERSFMIGLEQHELGENVVFTIRTFLSPNSVDRFGPSSFTIINGLPIILHSGFEGYIKPNSGLIKFLKDNYWKESTKGSVESAKNTVKNNTANSSTDSVNFISNHGIKRVPKSSIIEIRGERRRGIILPKSWKLYFKGNFLEQEMEDRLERISD